MKLGIGFALALGVITCGGCVSEPPGCQTARSINSYHATPQLPAQVRRVAVLPVTTDVVDFGTEEGRDALEPVLYAEVRKRAVVDVVVVTREDLWNLTGQREWTTAEVLPPDFFERLHKATDCDALVFCHLTYYRAYPPLGVGLKMRLVDAQKRTLWAVDEVFDASNPAVAAAARRYHSQCFRGPLDDPNTVLLSPRRFGQFATASALETVPRPR